MLGEFKREDSFEASIEAERLGNVADFVTKRMTESHKGPIVQMLVETIHKLRKREVKAERKEAEAVQKEAEAFQKAAESARKEAESDRKAAELAKKADQIEQVYNKSRDKLIDVKVNAA